MKQIIKSVALTAYLSFNATLNNYNRNIIKSEYEIYNKLIPGRTSGDIDQFGTFWDYTDTAYAKVNLTLHLDANVNVSEDYLNLCSLIQKICWGDDVYVKRISANESHILSQNYSQTQDGDYLLLIDETFQGSGNAHKHFPLDSTNLISKALNVTRQEDEKFLVLTRKKVPAGTGFGGGSADAAVILRHCTNQDNMKLIGSDVPFLASNYNVGLVTGIGDKIIPIDDITLDEMHEYIYLLLVDDMSSTTDVFANARKMISNGTFKSTQFESIVESTISMARNFSNFVPQNDLTPCVLSPKVKRLYDILLEKYRNYKVGMTGSGSGLYIIGNNDKDITQVRNLYQDNLCIIKTKFKSGKNNGKCYTLL
ncbi:bifunctional Ribosomal protein S5 domain 2-type fold/GHMP kinase [Babesia duncani]|uniref:Bifunctional Ribosomal protein S5 domain 2-type fold/GHMP kinase n=1 Tax=Babesia duncani TaxID=323732 RepID=A0AAD9PIF6_9APIC|nr:bifunctional Ribosomal protein S5 domain 2-type fold/GHMP kinase [Babesia duncani]